MKFCISIKNQGKKFSKNFSTNLFTLGDTCDIAVAGRGVPPSRCLIEDGGEKRGEVSPIISSFNKMVKVGRNGGGQKKASGVLPPPSHSPLF